MKKIVVALCLLLALAHNGIQAQSARKSGARDAFRSSQGYIGLFGGASFSRPFVQASFSDFSLIDTENTALVSDQKVYGPMFENRGAQFGISGVFTFNFGVSVALSPALQVNQYVYESQFAWEDVENPANYLEFTFTHAQQLHYFSLPLLIRYSPLKGKLRPYVQIGTHYDRLLNAQKNVRTEGLDRASGSDVAFQFSNQSSDISPLYLRSQLGLVAGAGITYNLGTLTFCLDGQYRYGLHTITNAQTRFSGSRDIAGFGNVLDDVSLRHLQLSLGCYFPLKFLTKDFSPVIL